MLVTHAIDFLHLADRIIIMESGSIKPQSPDSELEHSEEIKNVIETFAKTSVKDEAHKAEEFDDIIDEEPDKPAQRNSIRRSFLSSSGTNITEDENKELIDVGWRTYFKMFVEDKNWIVYVFVVILFLCYSY